MCVSISYSLDTYRGPMVSIATAKADSSSPGKVKFGKSLNSDKDTRLWVEGEGRRKALNEQDNEITT